MLSEEKKINLRVLTGFLFVNLMITVGISYQYILYSPSRNNLFSLLFLNVAIFSNFFLLYLPLAILIGLLFAFIPGRKAFYIISISVLVFLHVLNLIDVAIYRIFKIHINSMVLNLVFTEGAGDSLHLGARTFLTAGIILIGLILFEMFLIVWLRKKLGERKVSKKITAVVIGFFIVIVLADKLTFAVSDLYHKKEVLRHIKVFPLYQPLTVKHFMRRHFNFNTEKDEWMNVDKKNSALNYPKETLASKPLEKYPNIIWILVDAWRFDMFNPELTPNILAFSEKAAVFSNHYSGGNASRFGVFTLFYSIYGTYWHKFLSERQSPVLIDELKKLNYDFAIVASTSMANPEFRKTAFSGLPDKDIFDSLGGGDAGRKDLILTNTFLKWISSRESKKPFFAFLFYDAPHGPYKYPDEFDRYKPSNRNPNYITAGEKDALTLKNSYKNAICYDDTEVGKVLREVEKRGLLEDTIILISADHGEEFYEHGFWGHTSAFTDEQTRVPLILYVPGRKPEKIDYMTSHLDVVPTMLEMLGYTSDSSLYSQGWPLFSGKGHEYVVSSGWDKCAIIHKETFLIFSSESYNLAFFEVRDNDYRLVDNDRGMMKEKRPDIMKTLNGLNEFLK